MIIYLNFVRLAKKVGSYGYNKNATQHTVYRGGTRQLMSTNVLDVIDFESMTPEEQELIKHQFHYQLSKQAGVLKLCPDLLRHSDPQASLHLKHKRRTANRKRSIP